MNFDLRPNGYLLLQEQRVPRIPPRRGRPVDPAPHPDVALSPYWQSRVATGERIVQIDIAEMPKEEVSRIPEVPIRVPEAVPPPPPRPTSSMRDAVPAEAFDHTDPGKRSGRRCVAGAPEDVRRKGGADPLPEIRVPGDLLPGPSPCNPNPAD